MKRFIIKLSVLVFFVCLLVALINQLYMQTNYWKSENYVNQFDDVPYYLELGNVGSSHGLYSFMCDAVPEIKSANLALSSQPYFYDLKMLEKYIDHFEKNAVVIILISYFEITRRPDYSPYRCRYYRLLEKEDLDSWSLKDYIWFKKIPLFSANQNIWKIIHDISTEQMSPYYKRTSYLEEDELKDYCIEKHKSWTSADREKGQEGYNQNLKEVSAIIDLCLSHNLKPVLMTTPVTDVLNEIYENDGNFFPVFKQFTDELLKKYDGLEYFDYSKDEYFSKNHKLFMDGDHLNNFGAEEFTKKVVFDLQSAGYLTIN